MNELDKILRQVLSDVFVMYFKAHAFHWNVTGPYFTVMHDFFGEVYTQLHESIDPLAEQIRIHTGYAPTSLADMYAPTKIIESTKVGSDVSGMIQELISDNLVVLQHYKQAFILADQLNLEGLVDFLGGVIDAHDKLGWKLRSHLS